MGNQGFLLCVRRLQAPRLSLWALLAQVGSVCGLQGMAEGQERGEGKGTPPLKVPHLSGVSDSTGGGVGGLLHVLERGLVLVSES